MGRTCRSSGLMALVFSVQEKQGLHRKKVRREIGQVRGEGVKYLSMRVGK